MQRFIIAAQFVGSGSYGELEDIVSRLSADFHVVLIRAGFQTTIEIMLEESSEYKNRRALHSILKHLTESLENKCMFMVLN